MAAIQKSSRCHFAASVSSHGKLLDPAQKQNQGLGFTAGLGVYGSLTSFASVKSPEEAHTHSQARSQTSIQVTLLVSR